MSTILESNTSADTSVDTKLPADDAAPAWPPAGSGNQISGEDASPADAATPVDAPSDWTDEDLELARSYGYGDDDAKAEFENRADLERYVRRLDQRHRSRGEARLARETQPRSPAPQRAAAESPSAPPPAQGREKPLSQLLAEEGYDDRLVQLARRQEQTQAQHSQREQYLAGVVQQFQAAQLESAHAAFDHALESLGFAEQFGGSFEEADRNDAQYGARQQVWEELRRINMGRQEDGLPPLPFSPAVVKRVIAFAFPDLLEKQSQKQLKDRMAARSKQRTGSPGKRQVKPGPDANYRPQNDADLHEMWARHREGVEE